MTNIELLINLNTAENTAGNPISVEGYKLTKNKYLKKQYHGFKANVKYASRVLIKGNKPISIYFIFSDKNEINAYISKLRTKNPKYLIVCYSGIFTYSQNLFLWIMSSKHILPSIIEKKRKRMRNIDFDQFSAYFVTDRRLNLLNLSVPYILIGPDRIDHIHKDLRNEYALLLTSIATEFLFFHEMTHIDHGHIDYLKNISPKFDTLYSTNTTEKTNIQDFDKIIGIEQEADLGAAEYLFDSYWDLEYKGTLMKKFDLLLTTTSNLLFAIFYSLVWLFHLIQEFRNTRDVSTTNCHPSPECRILSVFRIFYILAEKKNGNKDLVRQQFSIAIKEYLDTCKLIAIDPYVKPEIFTNDSAAAHELIEVEKIRLSLLEELKPYHYSRKI